jgi:hypothetical protein
MAIARAVAVTAMLAGVALGLAAPVTAADQMSGHYIETETDPADGHTDTYDWYFTPCGAGCASITGARGGQFGQAQLVNGQWTFDTSADDDCTDGTRTPNALSIHYAWDPNTLAGTVLATRTVPVCGYSAGSQYSLNVQLTQAP